MSRTLKTATNTGTSVLVVNDSPGADAPASLPLGAAPVEGPKRPAGDVPPSGTPETRTSASPGVTASERDAGSAINIHTHQIETELREEDYTEQIWRDGTLHWGEKVGDGWTERWQTQEGTEKRFGSKRGRDVKNRREWQERWEQSAESGTRIEKRVTQKNEEDLDVERYIERLDISADQILETRVGEDRRTGRQWRLFSTFKLNEKGERQLQQKELEEVWEPWEELKEDSKETIEDGPKETTEDDPTKDDPTKDDPAEDGPTKDGPANNGSTPSGDSPTRNGPSARPRKLMRTCLQPGERVYRTTLRSLDEFGVEKHEESFEDVVTGTKWGRSECEVADSRERVVEEWSNTSDEVYERKQTRSKPGSTRGNVTSSDGREVYREEWGQERLDPYTQRSWSAKFRRRLDAENNPWGDYVEKIERVDEEGRVLEETTNNEKWWTESGMRFSEKWTQTSEFDVLTGNAKTLRKSGQNHYGDSAHERWHELYERAPGAEDLSLTEKRLEKDNLEERSVVVSGPTDEHHEIESKAIGQVEVWHVDHRTNERWGRKSGENSGVTWREEWSESPSEKWLEKWWQRGDCEWGELSGSRGEKEQWREQWRREGKSHWRERVETDAEGNSRTLKDAEEWEGDRLKDKYKDHYGFTVAGEKWAYKEGYNEHDGDWLEKWNETPLHKHAEKRGSNRKGDVWFEAWSEDFKEDGSKVFQTATKEGSNVFGEQWMETWTERPDGGAKEAMKKGARGDENWVEEWKEDTDGSKWCRKTASKSGSSWGQEWQEGKNSQFGKIWNDDKIVDQW